jgi:hypothetical protein
MGHYGLENMRPVARHHEGAERKLLIQSLGRDLQRYDARP